MRLVRQSWGACSSRKAGVQCILLSLFSTILCSALFFTNTYEHYTHNIVRRQRNVCALESTPEKLCHCCTNRRNKGWGETMASILLCFLSVLCTFSIVLWMNNVLKLETLLCCTFKCVSSLLRMVLMEQESII